MASTILLKHGPGAPTSGELEYRELGYDHTNHKLYIGNSSGGVTLLNPTFNGGTITSSLTPSGGIAYAGNENYIAYPGGGSFTATSQTFTGFLKIILPVSWNSTMIKFKVSIYYYVNDTSADYYIGGYNFSGNGGQWTCLSAYSIGVGSIANLPVTFGHDGSKCLIAIGSATTTWNYPQVVVSDVTIGFSGGTYNAFKTGWSVVINNTAISNIDKTISNPKITSNIITGAASTIASSNLTASKALISNSSGKVAVSSVSSTELGYLDGVTSSIQTQLNGKAASSHTHKYAGSSSAGGAANSANKLNTDAGSSTQPVYFAGGKPVAATPYASAYVNGLVINDTRNTMFAPSAHNNIFLVEFKAESTAQTGANANFGCVTTIKPYTDNSGGAVYQLSLMYDGDRTKPRMFLRSAGPEDSWWGNWEEIFTEYKCHPNTIVTKRNNAYVQEFSASTLSGGYHSDFGMATTVLACNGDRAACTDAITATTKVSSSTYRLVFDAASSDNMRINLIVFRF